MLKIAIITNIPAPYRIPVYRSIARIPGVTLLVIFCCEREPNREWDIPTMDFCHIFLRKRFVTVNGFYIHNNFDVVSALRKFAPDVAVTTGFNPTHLYAFAYSWLNKCVHVPMTDGTLLSERTLSFLHRLIRRIVYARSNAFISASLGGEQLYKSYGVPADHSFKSRLCVDNAAFCSGLTPAEKPFDFIFCGRIESVKNPHFAFRVALEVAHRLHRKVRILFVGSGGQEAVVKDEAAVWPDLVDAVFAGFATQHELPRLYQSARLFLFPSLWDPWGVVANEACAAGLPVIVSPHAGVAGELVLDGENGFVCELDVGLWAERAVLLLTRPDVYQEFSERSRALVSDYTFDHAAAGLVAACRFAVQSNGTSKAQTHTPSETKTPRRVVILQRRLTHYRVPFFNRLRHLLGSEGIELQLLVGECNSAEKQKKDEGTLDWAIKIPNRYMLGDRLCWQPAGVYANGADLVIIPQENSLLYNQWLLNVRRPRRIAFWGHGRNMQSRKPDGLKERFKRRAIKKVDWWFAYTEITAALITKTGFSSAKTTVVDNAIDTDELVQFCAQVSAADCHRMREQLGLESGPVGLYLGSLYEEKRLGFLLEAAQRIRAVVPGFQLLIAGAGPEHAHIEAAARQHRWVHYLGPLQGSEKAVALVLADVMLNPGLVGLAILDSFAGGTPMFTSDCGLHSPEIAYLESGVNGVITADDIDSFAAAVTEVLTHPDALAGLKTAALASAGRYTIANMADRFCAGIIACLSAT